MNILSLDLEYNQPSRSIIQVGFAVGNLESGLILDSQSYYIKQEETLNPFIIELTGIQQIDVDQGIELQEAYQALTDSHKEFQCFRNWLTWGGGDSEDLRLALNLDNKTFSSGRRWIDAKTVYVSYCFANNIKHQSGLKKSMKNLGLDFYGRPHDARYDAINTFFIYHKLLQEMR